MAGDIQILYQDKWLVAVYKPANILVHKSPISADETFLLQMLRRQIRKRVYPIHRLDRPTCGVMVFALDSETLSILNQQVREQRMEKRYLAVVRGWVPQEETIDYALKFEDEEKEISIVKSAITLYTLLDKAEHPIPVRPYKTSRYSLVEVTPQTGRRHQIRRHFAHIRHPIIGDVKYGDGKHNQMFREHFNSHRLLLLSSSLKFTHPHTQIPISVTTAPDSQFQDILQRVFPGK